MMTPLLPDTGGHNLTCVGKRHRPDLRYRHQRDFLHDFLGGQTAFNHQRFGTSVILVLSPSSIDIANGAAGIVVSNLGELSR